MSENHATVPHDSDLDPFWVEQRAKHLAEKSTSADPNACGTCCTSAEAGQPVKHDECQQRATLLQAPDHPDYEILAGFSLEENAKLPARFHVPVFDDCGKPNAWLCAVCWEEGVVTGWPCATAVKYGTKVFSPLHEAETAQKKMSAAVDELRAENASLKARVAELQGEGHLTVADVVAWLVKKSHEYGDSNRENRAKAEAVGRMADKISRGAIRPTETSVPRTERERWVGIAAALNAAHNAGMPVGIDLDGTLTDHRAWSVIWDRAAERWTVAGYDDDAEDVAPGTRQCGHDDYHTGHEWADQPHIWCPGHSYDADKAGDRS